VWLTHHHTGVQRFMDVFCRVSHFCGDNLQDYLQHELLRDPPPTALDPAAVDSRVADLAAALRRVGSRPCMITLCRSNKGGYMPLSATAMVEEKALAMLRELYGEETLVVQGSRSGFPLGEYGKLSEGLEQVRVREVPESLYGRELDTVTRLVGRREAGMRKRRALMDKAVNCAIEDCTDYRKRQPRRV